MLFKRVLLSAAAAALLAGPAFADGSPVPEPEAPPAPPAPPAEEEVAPPPPPPPPPPAFESGFYVEGYGGLTFSDELDWDFDPYETELGYNLGGAIGAHLSPNWDVEIDVFYATMDYECCTTDISGLSTMVDLIYNLDTGWMIDPYLGAGVGVTRVHYDGSTWNGLEGSEWAFGYQLMAGLMVDLSSSFGIFAEYRYHDVAGDDFDLGWADDIEYHSHNISAGIQVTF